MDEDIIEERTLTAEDVYFLSDLMRLLGGVNPGLAWREAKRPEFPAPFLDCPKHRAWYRDEVDDYFAEHPERIRKVRKP